MSLHCFGHLLFYRAFPTSCQTRSTPTVFHLTPCKRPWSIKEYFHHKGFIIYTCIFLEIIPCLVVFLCYFEIFRGMFITKTIFSALDGPNAQTLEDWRSTKQLLKLLVWITVLFLICFLPFAVFFIYLVAVNKTTVAGNHDRLFFCHRMVLFLINANSFFNPLVYAFQSSNYRKGFKRIFCCKSVSQTNVWTVRNASPGFQIFLFVLKYFNWKVALIFNL